MRTAHFVFNCTLEKALPVGYTLTVVLRVMLCYLPEVQGVKNVIYLSPTDRFDSLNSKGVYDRICIRPAHSVHAACTASPFCLLTRQKVDCHDIVLVLLLTLCLGLYTSPF